MNDSAATKKIGRDGRYAVISTLGTGGQGQTLLAMDGRLNRRVAVKLLAPEALKTPLARQRFAREAKILASLAHPSLVPVYDAELEGGEPFIVQEYVEGRDLSRLLAAQGPLSPEKARLLARDLAGALAALHEAGVLHRDLKPSNVMVDLSGRARLIDFGLAIPLESTRLTQSGGLVGTLFYLTPEVLRGQDATAASDVFQVGLVLHEALTGRHRYYQGGLPQSYLLRMAAGALPLPTATASLPPDLAAVIDACCTLDPTSRPVDGTALARLLEDTAPVADSSLDLSATDGEPHARPLPGPPGPEPRPPGPPARSALLPALILVGLLLATALIMSRHPAPAIDVVGEAVEWLRFPDGFTVTFHGGLAQAPSWTCSWPGGQASGAFLRQGGHWTAAPTGLTWTGTVALTVLDRDRVLSRRSFVPPGTALDGPVTVRTGVTWGRLSWHLFGHGTVDLTVSPDGTPLRLRTTGHTLRRPFADDEQHITRKLPYRLSHRGRVLASGTLALGPATVYTPGASEAASPLVTAPFLPLITVRGGLALASSSGPWSFLVPRPDAGDGSLTAVWSSPAAERMAGWDKAPPAGLHVLRCGSPGTLEHWEPDDDEGRSWRATTHPLVGPVTNGLVRALPDGGVVAFHGSPVTSPTLEWFPGTLPAPAPLPLPGDEVLGLWSFGPGVVAVVRLGRDSVIYGLALDARSLRVAWRHVVDGAMLSRSVPSKPLRNLQPDDQTLVTAVDHRVIVLRRSPDEPSNVTMTLHPLDLTSDVSVGAILTMPSGGVLVAVATPVPPGLTNLSLFRLDLTKPPTVPPTRLCEPLLVMRAYGALAEWGALFDHDRLLCPIGNQFHVIDTKDGATVTFEAFSVRAYRFAPVRLGDFIVQSLSAGPIEALAGSD